MIPSNTLQFQYFAFQLLSQSNFSQLSFENFWLYLLGVVVMTQNSKLLEIIMSHLLKVRELKV